MDALDELEGGPASQNAYGDEAQDPNVARQHGGQDSGHQLGQTEPLDPLTAVQQQKQQYLDWFKQYITSHAGLDIHAITADTLAALEPYAALQVSQLVTSLYKANASQSSLSGLKYWAEAVRELERKQRDVQELAPLSDATFDLQTYTTAMQAAIQALAAAIYASGYPTYYASSVADVPALAQATSTIDARMHHCRYEVYSRLSSDATSLLEACHWPPPLVQPKKQPHHALPNGHAGLSDEPLENGLPDGMHSSQGAGEQSQPEEGSNQAAQAFDGFESDGLRLSRLLAVLTCLTSLQLVVERAAFEQAAGGDESNAGEQLPKETPVLWAASCLAAPLQGRLQLHFQPDKHAGRLDQPAWIFKLVMRLVQDYAGCMAVLQPVLEASGLTGRCHMVVEWARAMRDATKAVLRTARLPALVERWEGQQDEQACKLWAAQVDAILAFEKQLAPYLGAPAALQGPVALLPDGLLPGSVLGAITEDEGFLDTWVEVLRHHAITRLEEAIEDDAQAWKVGAHLLPDSNGHAPGSGPPPPVPPGSSREFNPPQLAELVSDSITSLVQLAAQTPTLDIQRSLLDRVGAPLLSRTRELLRKSFDEAAQYQGLTSHAGAPYAGACVAAARYLHHVVSELLAGPMLHRLHAAGHGSGPQAAGGSPGISPGGQPGAPETSPSKGPLGDVVVRHSFTPVAWDPPVLSAAVNQLGALHREMCLRVAQELSGLFGRGAAEYRAVVDAAVQYPTHTGAAGTVTPLLLPALTALQAGLAALNEPLDGPSFRDIWRAVAVPVNRYMFNYIATEARFTAAGAEQFEVDCSGVVACFAPYTKRPNAHFREMLAAAKILTLSEEDASDVVRRATTAPVKGIPLYKEPRLAQLGVSCLLPAHVVAVVDRRM